MSLASRVRRLERVRAAKGCLLCGGMGKCVSVRDTDPDTDPDADRKEREAEGCPACGEILLIRVRRAERIDKDLAIRAQVRYCSKAALQT